MSNSRRDFLKKTAVGLALAGLSGPLSVEGLWKTKYAIPQGGTTYIPLSDEVRRKIIAMANFGRKEMAASSKGMAICSHPLATHEAVRVLAEGGNACDAVLTASLCQTVVEPHMTTITGVYSMLYYDAASGKTIHLNGSNNRPLEGLEKFNRLNLVNELKTGRGVTVPGFWAGFEASWEKFGSLPKKRLMAPAIHYARHGFEIHPFLFGEIFVQSEMIGKNKQGREIYFPDKALARPGQKLYQKRAADLLDRLAEEGNSYFYNGEFARKFSAIVQGAKGVITPKDFEAYEVMWQEPAWGTYRGYDLAGSPPPDFGGSQMIELLHVTELLDLQKLGPVWDSPDTTEKFILILNEVLMDAIKQRYQNKIEPLEKLLSKEHAAARYDKLFGVKKGPSPPMDLPYIPTGSNHVTVADKQGNVATVLHSCMSFPWSNGLFVEGVNICAAGAHYGVGMPDPGQRIHARICPVIIFKDKKPVLSAGSPSISLMENMMQNITNVLDFKMPLDEAVHKPRFGGSSLSMTGARIFETDLKPAILDRLRSLKWRLDVVNPWNWHHGTFEGIHIDPATRAMSACADPRRAGGAEGV